MHNSRQTGVQAHAHYADRDVQRIEGLANQLKYSIFKECRYYVIIVVITITAIILPYRNVLFTVRFA